MSQAVSNPGGMESPRWEAGSLERAHLEALHRPSRRRTVGTFRGVDDAPYDGDLHLLDGRGWWCPWLGGVLWLAVPAIIKLVPGRPWWEFMPAFAFLGVGLGVVYFGWRVGNPIQKACCLCIALAMLALGAKIGDWAIGTHIHSGSLQQMDTSYEM